MNVQGCFSAATLLSTLQGQPPTAHIYFKISQRWGWETLLQREVFLLWEIRRMVSANHKKGLRAASSPETRGSYSLIPFYRGGNWDVPKTKTTRPRSFSYWDHEAVTQDQSCLYMDPKAFPAKSELSGAKALKRNVGWNPFLVEELIL